MRDGEAGYRFEPDSPAKGGFWLLWLSLMAHGCRERCKWEEEAGEDDLDKEYNWGVGAWLGMSGCTHRCLVYR